MLIHHNSCAATDLAMVANSSMTRQEGRSSFDILAISDPGKFQVRIYDDWF